MAKLSESFFSLRGLLVFIVFSVAVFLFFNLQNLPLIGTGLLVYSAESTPSALVLEVLLFMWGVVCAGLCFLAAKIFVKELKGGLTLVSLGIAIIALGFFLEIEYISGITLVIEITPALRNLVTVAGFAIIFFGLYSIYAASLKIQTTYHPYKKDE
ncbi:MAG: hypothetical protein V1494_02620 [Candidatus Diapherotrites archaeon]